MPDKKKQPDRPAEIPDQPERPEVRPYTLPENPPLPDEEPEIHPVEEPEIPKEIPPFYPET